MAITKAFTSLEQSKRLTEILPLESADNVIVSFGSRDGVKTVIMPKETLDVIRTPFADIRETTMCWSLAALLCVLPKIINNETLFIETSAVLWHIGYRNIYTARADNPVDACYEMIIHLHELNLL